MLPFEIPTDLTVPTLDELRALQTQIADYVTEHAADPYSDEAMAALRAARDGAVGVAAEIARRETLEAEQEAERASIVAEAQAALADATAPAPEPGAAAARPTGTPSPAPAPAPVTAAPTPAPAPAPAPVAAEPVTAAGGAAALPPLPGQAATALAPAQTFAGGGVLLAPRPLAPEPQRPPVTIMASADVPGFGHNEEISLSDGFLGIAHTIVARSRNMGQASGPSGEYLPCATIRANLPAERQLDRDNAAVNLGRIREFTSQAAITAAGGLCAPVNPYYEILSLAEATRPVRDALPVFEATRGGIRYIPPPQWSQAGIITRVTAGDGNTTVGVNTLSSASAAFTAADVGATLSSSVANQIPAGAYIVSVTNATTVVMSANAGATSVVGIITVNRPGSVGYITAAQDAAALGGTAAQVVAGTKPCIHVSCPAVVEVTLATISHCVEFGNLTARAYPEQVAAWMGFVLAAWARRAEVALLDGLASFAASPTTGAQVTAAQVVGVARQLNAQIFKAAAYYRNRNRMDPNTTLRVILPAWVIDAMAADLVLGSGYDAEFFAATRAYVQASLAMDNINISYYLDSGTGKGQYLNAGAQHVSGSLTAFPTTAVWYMFAEGSVIFLDGGTLDLGVVRDSQLNSQNNYRLFGESFENIAMIGPEILEVTSTIVASGAASGTVNPPASF